MSIDRREFLKIAGLAGAGIGLAGVNLLFRTGVDASQFSPPAGALTAKRWGMVVDIRKFSTDEDYSSVIEACHRVHNVPHINNPDDEVKWIWTDTFKHAFPGQQNEYIPGGLKEKPILLFCNHCENPPCVRVCPTKATFKRQDGIVVQDYHRCIGCRFCMAACPYGSRSFNWVNPRPYIKETDPGYPTRMIGVVEKCNFCAERLARGLQPACVEASKGALVFGDLEDPASEVRKVLAGHYSLRRKPELGTQPSVFYILGGEQDA